MKNDDKWLMVVENDGHSFDVIASSRGEAEYLIGDKINHAWMISFKYVRNLGKEIEPKVVQQNY
jgi:hypothetical protein